MSPNLYARGCKNTYDTKYPPLGKSTHLRTPQRILLTSTHQLNTASSFRCYLHRPRNAICANRKGSFQRKFTDMQAARRFRKMNKKKMGICGKFDDDCRPPEHVRGCQLKSPHFLRQKIIFQVTYFYFLV